jgi:Na+-transporting methylmalonyl-CoA/oxaloacetate decarboxylase gamma subunit
MIQNLIQSLWITLLGMGLVFVAIVLLWGLMALMTAIRLERKSEEQVEDIEIEKKRQAAALAVSAALALTQQAEAHISIFPLPPTAVVSAWQLSRRTDNLNKQGIVRR